MPATELAAAVAAEGAGRTTLTGGYNCLFVETTAGLAVIDTGLGAHFLGYGPVIGAQVGQLAGRMAELGLASTDLAAVIFTHLHQDHVRGHTPGHAATLLESAGERLLCTGDSFYDRLQLRNPGWCTPWDHDAPRATASRRRLLAQAADDNIGVHAYHLPFPGLGVITRHRDAFEWRPAT